MPRLPRVMVEGGLYHVYNRFARGEAVFEDDREISRFVDLLQEVKLRDGWVVLAWCILSNHFHLAVRMGAVPLSRSMRSMQGRFSQSFNLRHERTGPLWQSRYQARLVGEGAYLRRLILYVHLNPVRAGLAEDPAQYRWCGHAEMLGRRRGTLLDVDDALLVFGETRGQARQEYVAAAEAALIEGGHQGELRGEPWWSREAELKLCTDVSFVDELGRSTGPVRSELEADEFLSVCAEILDVPVDDVRSRRRGETLTQIRELVAALGLQRWGQSSVALAEVLGMYPDSVGRQATRGERRAMADPGFRARMDDLDRELVRRVGERG